MKRSHIIILIITALLIVDQLFKLWVKTHMTLDQSIPMLGDWFQLRFIENPGAAFGFELGGSAGKLALSLFRIAAVGVLGWFIFGRLIPRRQSMGVVVGFALILAGAAGNIFDSAFYGLIFSESSWWQAAQIFPEGGGYAGFLHGKVVDMLYFPVIRNAAGDPLFFRPIFNLADSYITIGVLYMIIFRYKFFK